MTNHPNRSKNAKIARAYIKARPGVEHVKINGAFEVHAYGPMLLTDRIGWYFAGYVDDLAARAEAERDAAKR